jgi:hypothetical protein
MIHQDRLYKPHYRITFGRFAVMKTETSAFRLGLLLRGKIVGVPLRCCGGLFTAAAGIGLFVVIPVAPTTLFLLAGVVPSIILAVGPSLCERVRFVFEFLCEGDGVGFDVLGETAGRLGWLSVTFRVDSGAVVVLLGVLTPVRALNLSSRSWSDLSTTGFSRMVTASGALEVRGGMGALIAAGVLLDLLLCRTERL